MQRKGDTDAGDSVRDNGLSAASSVGSSGAAGDVLRYTRFGHPEGRSDVTLDRPPAS